jgi:hypothetical protein
MVNLCLLYLSFAVMVIAPSCCTQACDEMKPSIVLVTQDICPACRPAKKVIEKMTAEGKLDAFIVKELHIRRDRKQIEATGAIVTSTPTVLLIDKEGLFVTSATSASETGIKNLIEMIPVVCYLPVKEVPMPSSEPIGAPGDQVITWDLATMYKQGYYNGTFAFSEIEHALNSISRYKKLTFKRVSRGGQYHVIQANYQLKNSAGIAGWNNGSSTYISPTFRFVNPVQSNMVTVHERWHSSGVNGGSGGHHAQDGGVMGPNGGYTILPSDYPWIARYPWRNSLRPTDEPDWFRAYLSKQAVLGSDDQSQFPLLDVQAPKE